MMFKIYHYETHHSGSLLFVPQFANIEIQIRPGARGYMHCSPSTCFAAIKTGDKTFKNFKTQWQQKDYWLLILQK